MKVNLNFLKLRKKKKKILLEIKDIPDDLFPPNWEGKKALLTKIRCP